MFSTSRGSNLSLRNRWRNYGGSYRSATVVKTGSLCLVSGLIRGGGWGLLAQLPSGCRPKGRLIFNMNNHQYSSRVDVLKNGQIRWVTGGRSHGWISLTGINIHRNNKGSVKSCKSSKVYSPGYSRCKASSVWGNDRIGHSHGLGRLNSRQAWSARHNKKGQWWQMDAGSAKPIVGLRTQGRKGGSNNQRVTSYKVKTSLNGRSWTYVDGGKVFAANKARSDTTVANKFSAPVTARYVRIIVQSWKKHASMRAALDVGKHCSG